MTTEIIDYLELFFDNVQSFNNKKVITIDEDTVELKTIEDDNIYSCILLNDNGKIFKYDCQICSNKVKTCEILDTESNAIEVCGIKFLISTLESNNIIKEKLINIIEKAILS